MSLTVLKAIHLLGAVLFLGNIIVTAFWKTLADRTGELAVIRFAVKATNWADVVFTLGGIVLLAAAGQMMAPAFGGVAANSWLKGAYALFAATGVLWLAVLIPVQWKQARLLNALPDGAAVPAAYRRLALVWAAAGSAATLMPLAAAWLMVAKPA
ncbi:DUF2269 family protein [Herbaspirillum sp.]|uniref:DUF2269 family protein n=1 Tax=Herbaspirillum sp. TaxID=1890675 RepID=UPI001B0FAF43|nr:DUF2269 family protein [Herbaspirillum sp.]MBO9537953.1 DUF2269 family protein [Herbaspirillum sp.]